MQMIMITICINYNLRYALRSPLNSRISNVQMKFLCDHHKQWVMEQPDEALNYIKGLEDELQYASMMQDERKQSAIFGSGIETITLLLRQHKLDIIFLSTRLTNLSIRFANFLEQREKYGLASKLISSSIATLLLLKDSNQQNGILNTQLNSYGSRLKIKHAALVKNPIRSDDCNNKRSV